MRLIIRLSLAFYPAWWRARYGAELEALVEDMDCGWGDCLDMFKGAIQMHILSGRTWRFLSACAVAGLLVAGVVALRSDHQFRSTTVLRMSAGDSNANVAQLSRAEEAVFSRHSLSEVIQKYGLYPDERKKVPLESIVQEMRNRRIQVRMLDKNGEQNSARAFLVRYEYSDPAKAQAVTSEIAGDLIAAMKDSAPLEVLDPPNMPERAFQPNVASLLGLGLAFGIGAGVVLLVIRRCRFIPLSDRQSGS